VKVNFATGLAVKQGLLDCQRFRATGHLDLDSLGEWRKFHSVKEVTLEVLRGGYRGGSPK
jgi:hypothetical protein